MSDGSAAPPGVLDLVVDALWKRSAYQAVVDRGSARALLAVLTMLTLVSLVTGVQNHLHLGAQIDAARDSALWLMPRLNIEEGVARAEWDGPRTLTSERFVVHVDTATAPELVQAPPGDLRPRYFVLRHALVVFTVDRPGGTALPWTQLNAVLGPVSVNGEELVTALEEGRTRMAVAVAALRALAALLLITIAASVAAPLYRVVFFARRRLPSTGGLRAAALLAGVPGLAAAGLISLVVGRDADDGLPLLALAVVGATAFFLAAAGLESADEPAPGA